MDWANIISVTVIMIYNMYIFSRTYMVIAGKCIDLNRSRVERNANISYMFLT